MLGRLVVAMVCLATISGCAAEESGSSGDSDASTAASADGGGGGSTDTGRMSDTEFDTWSMFADDATTEFQQFGEILGGKCAVLAGAGDLNGFSTCVEDAYGGVEDDAFQAINATDDVKGDTAKACRKALSRYRRATVKLGTIVQQVDRAGENLDVSGINFWAKQVPKVSNVYGAAYQQARVLCTPK